MIKTAAMTCWTAPTNGRLPGTRAMWSLSALLALEHFDRVELFTDREGHRLLCEELQLPFSLVRRPISLESGLPTNVWSLGKVLTYLQLATRGMKFVHVDADVFLLNALPEALLQSDVLAEMPEEWEATLPESMSWLPSKWAKGWRAGGRSMWNCGIFGGNDWSAIADWAHQVISSASQNAGVLSRIDGTAASILLEQWTLSQAFKPNQVETLFANQVVSGDDAQVAGYAHFKGGCKKDPFFRNLIERELRKRYPRQADLVASLDRR